jgi:diguanylate cyclase (GGDEF)-like protein
VRILPALRARDPHAAARSAVLILAVCTGALAGLNIIQGLPMGSFEWVVSWLGVVVLAVTAAACLLIDPERMDRVGACALMAVGGVVLVCALNVLTNDTSAAAQAFLAFPVLWVASHLRRGAVILVTTTAVLADCVTLFLLLPAADAATDVVFFGAVLVVMAVMLVRAGTALVLIDVDAFKTINDRHGHPVGDDVLVHLAGVLREQIRAEDAVLSRLGGDELAVLLPGCTAAVARRRAEELLGAVRSHPLLLPDGTLLSLSISLGVAHMPRRSGKLRTLYHAADAALYDAKRNGRGRVAVAAV